MSISAEFLEYLLHIPKTNVQLLTKQLIVLNGFSAFTHSLKMNNELVIRPL